MRHTSNQQGAVTVFHVEGAMVRSALSGLADSLRVRSSSGQPRLLLDLTAVSTMDSATLEMLSELQENCRKRGGVLKLTGLNPLCLEIMKVTGLHRRFEIFDNQLTALGSFAA
ncbi:MAG: STAS domain-containing protein [Planctomycetaceae bacterium]